jgi:hypothetical protein
MLWHQQVAGGKYKHQVVVKPARMQVGMSKPCSQLGLAECSKRDTYRLYTICTFAVPKV